jgi:hypothetical protein
MVLTQKIDIKTSGTEERTQIMYPCSYAHLIFDKVAKNISWRKDSFFNNQSWENWLSACRKLKLVPCLSPCTSINTEWIKDLNIRPKTLWLVQEKAGNTLETTGITKDFLSRTPAVQQLRNDGQMGLHEIKRLLHNKRNVL